MLFEEACAGMRTGVCACSGEARRFRAVDEARPRPRSDVYEAGPDHNNRFPEQVEWRLSSADDIEFDEVFPRICGFHQSESA